MPVVALRLVALEPALLLATAAWAGMFAEVVVSQPVVVALFGLALAAVALLAVVSVVVLPAEQRHTMCWPLVVASLVRGPVAPLLGVVELCQSGPEPFQQRW